MNTPPQLAPFGSRPPWAQMRPEVSPVRDHRAEDAAIVGLRAGFGTSTIGRHYPEGSRNAQSAPHTSAASHNRLDRTTQARSSRG